MSGPVGTRLDIRTGQIGELLNSIQSCLPFCKITSIHQQVGLIRQGLANHSQFVGILRRHRLCVERAGAQLQLTGTAVRDEMNGIYTAAPSQ